MDTVKFSEFLLWLILNNISYFCRSIEQYYHSDEMCPILSFIILYPYLSNFIPFLSENVPFFFWFYIFGKTTFNTLMFIKYIKYWYGLPLRMSYIMGIFKRWRYYLFSGQSVTFWSMAFVRYYKIEKVPQLYADLNFYLDLDFLLNPLWFSTIFFYNPLIFGLYCRFYFILCFFSFVIF